MNRIGTMCDFDYLNCQRTCPSGYESVGWNMNSCGTCRQIPPGISQTGRYISRSTSPFSYVIFDRANARSLFINRTIELPPDETRTFDDIWQNTDTNTVFVRLPGLFGFFSYTLTTSGSTITIRLSDTNTRLYNSRNFGVELDQSNITFQNGTLQFGNTTLTLEQ